MLKVTFDLKHSELDNFENGCDCNGISEFIEPIEIEAPTVKELVSLIRARFNVSEDSVLLNSCDELGRVDVQTYTKSNKGVKCSYHKHVDGFRRGDFDLWLHCFTGKVVQTVEDLDLQALYDNVKFVTVTSE